MRIFIDMDGTLAEWKAESKFSELFKKGYFTRLKPVEGVISLARALIAEGCDVYILTKYLTESKYASKEKNKWLDLYLNELPEAKRIFVPYCEEKVAFIPDGIKETDVLLDDHNENLVEWRNAGGFAIKILNGVNNTHGSWNGMLINPSIDPKEFLRAIRKI